MKTKNKILWIILLISMFIVIPNFEIPIEEKNHNEIINTRPPQESSVYYEDTTGLACGVYVSGDYAYVADGDEGLAIINISDPTNPGTPIYEDTLGYAHDIYVSGDYAYMATGWAGLAVIDISDPTEPGTPVYEGTSGAAYSVYVSGDYAYVAALGSGLAVIDISNPTDPGTPVYEVTDGDAWGVYVSGDYAYVADRFSGLAVIDVSDPTNPGTPINEDTTGEAVGVYVSGNYAYVADYSSGLAVIDISNSTDPGTPIYGDTIGYAYGVYVSGNYVYVAVDHRGLVVIDISDPTNPGTPVYEDTTGSASDVYVSGDYAYVADDGSGLAVIDISDMTNPVITVSPNDITIEYEYTGQSISWTADGASPDTYTIELQGTGVVAGPTAWTSGNAINYNIPDGHSVGSYIYTVAFTDDYDNFITDSVNFTVEDTTNPTIISAPSDLTVELGYWGQSISWTATDSNPNTYTIELQGTEIVAGPTAWTSGNAINYNIPDGFASGFYSYKITFTDESGNSISNTVWVQIKSPGGAIPIGNSFLIFIGFSVIFLIFIKKRQIIHESR